MVFDVAADTSTCLAGLRRNFCGFLCFPLPAMGKRGSRGGVRLSLEERLAKKAHKAEEEQHHREDSAAGARAREMKAIRNEVSSAMRLFLLPTPTKPFIRCCIFVRTLPSLLASRLCSSAGFCSCLLCVPATAPPAPRGHRLFPGTVLSWTKHNDRLGGWGRLAYQATGGPLLALHFSSQTPFTKGDRAWFLDASRLRASTLAPPFSFSSVFLRAA